MEEQKSKLEISDYFLTGLPVVRLFNHYWGQKEKSNSFVYLRYERYSENNKFIDNILGDDFQLHLVKMRSESSGRYGSGTYGSDEDFIYSNGSFIKITYQNVNPAFERPLENSHCSVKIFSDNSENVEKTKKVLEDICGIDFHR